MKLEICDITKQYKDKRAVDHVSLTLTPGIWGLLGANGAGKTTLMRMIAGIQKPTSGCIRYDGIEIGTLKEAYRDVFGYLPQEFGFYPGFHVWEYLEYIAALKGLGKAETKKKIEGLLEMLSLQEVRKKQISKLSGGMKRRVGIAQAMLNDPEVLILDEPTSGLDPGERVRFRNLLSEFARGQDRADIYAYRLRCGIYCYLQCDHERREDYCHRGDGKTGAGSGREGMECPDRSQGACSF